MVSINPVTFEVTESSPALQNSTKEYKTLISEDTVTPTAEHDIIQVAAILESQE